MDMTKFLAYPALLTWSSPDPRVWQVVFNDGRVVKAMNSGFVRVRAIEGQEFPEVFVAAIDTSWSSTDSNWYLPDWEHKRAANFDVL